MKTVVVVSPHPDDEILGAGATLALLKSHGWRVVNLACSLGKPADQQRRREELLEAATRIGFDTVIMDPPIPISSNDDLVHAEHLVSDALEELIDEVDAHLVVAPHPDDGHHGHEAVGRGVRRALARSERRVPWWMWGLWAELPSPTLYVPFGEATLATVARALNAHAGENARNAFHRLLPARAVAATVLGSERVFGFGAAQADPAPYAELLTEITFDGTSWHRGSPRIMNPASPEIPQLLTAGPRL
ncbi:PIG-L deacetylase family protein [Mycolicibacterium lacusdiani]|uniref:PIG-L deacetylase family protein n=1 Tax=Mycolicibacterium lacusdiani TaxID=2895283 RepID=UPI001F2D9F40|nr:PIG-L family deacetylase [Mycolicibacterium lacusdiani]